MKIKVSYLKKDMTRSDIILLASLHCQRVGPYCTPLFQYGVAFRSSRLPMVPGCCWGPDQDSEGVHCSAIHNHRMELAEMLTVFTKAANLLNERPMMKQMYSEFRKLHHFAYLVLTFSGGDTPQISFKGYVRSTQYIGLFGPQNDFSILKMKQ